jgi:hypothetical protein
MHGSLSKVLTTSDTDVDAASRYAGSRSTLNTANEALLYPATRQATAHVPHVVV